MADVKTLHLNDLMYVYFRDAVDELKEALRNLTEVSVDTGVADATSTVNQLDDVAKNWPVNAFQYLIVEITVGTGAGQLRKINTNTATALLPVTPFATAPDGTSEYRIGFYGRMASDITHWGSTLLTGRDISLDLKALTDDGIKGILKTLGDIGVGDNLIALIGPKDAAAVAAGAAGDVAAKLRALSRDLVANIVLATGANVIGGVTVADGSDATQGAIADAAVAAGAAGTEASKLRRLTTDLNAVMLALQILDDWDAPHGTAVTADGVRQMLEAKTFNGAALPNTVSEGENVRAAGSEAGVKYMFLTNPDGSLSPHDQVNNALQVIEQADARQQSETVEIQTATTIIAAETVIGGEISTLGFNTIAFFVDYSKGDEDSYDLIPKMLRVSGGDEHVFGTWSSGTTKTWTAEVFRQTASALVYIVLDVTGINLLKIYGDATGGTPTGTCQLGYTLTNN